MTSSHALTRAPTHTTHTLDTFPPRLLFAELMRDAKIYQIYEGTSQIQRLIVSRDILGDNTLCTP